jgi:hypothetical protein
MSIAPAESLRTTNLNLRAELVRLGMDPSGVSAAVDLPGLLAEISRTADVLRSIPPDVVADATFQQELREYRGNLEQLRKILPSVHVRLQVEKTRLETALEHVQTAATWAHASEDSF